MNRQLRGNLPPNEKANGKNRFLSLLLLFMAFISVQVYAQDVKVSGTVIAEADKFPIIGANIVVKGTTIGTVTDIAYIIHSGFISGYQNRYGDNLKPPTNVYHRMTA